MPSLAGLFEIEQRARAVLHKVEPSFVGKPARMLYRIYAIDADGASSGYVHIEFQNDRAALMAAHVGLEGDQEVEVWCCDRCVGRIGYRAGRRSFSSIKAATAAIEPARQKLEDALHTLTAVQEVVERCLWEAGDTSLYVHAALQRIARDHAFESAADRDGLGTAA